MSCLSPRLLLFSSTLLSSTQLLAQPAAEAPATEAPATEAPATAPEGPKEPATADAKGSAGDTQAEAEAREPASDLEGYVPPGSEGSDLNGYAPPTAEDSAGPASDEHAVDSASEDPPGLPAPGPPRDDEQLPAPIAAESEPSVSRRVLLSLYFGPVLRTSEHERVSYGTSLAWGPSAAVDVASWLRVVGYARIESIPVAAKQGAFDTARTEYPDTSIQQDSLDSHGLGLRAAPTLAVRRWLRFMGFVDLAWNRFTAAAPETDGATEVRSAERAGVSLNYKAGVGVSVEPIANWFDVSLNASYGFFTSQTGTAFRLLQGFDQTGNIVHLAPLPRFERSFELLLSAGIIL